MLAFNLYTWQGDNRDVRWKHGTYRFPVRTFAHEDHACLSKFGNVLRSDCGQRGEHAHSYIARANDRQVGHEPMRSIAGQHDHILAVAKSILQRCGNRFHLPSGFGPAVIDTALFTKIAHPNFIALGISPVVEELRQGLEIHYCFTFIIQNR